MPSIAGEQAGQRAPSRPESTAPWTAAGVCVGLAMIVGGTFLPWLRSGTVERDSYSADAALRNVLHVHGFPGAVLVAWPFLSALCAAAAALVLLRRRLIGTALAAACAVAAGAVAIAVLVARHGVLAAPASTGPALTLCGASVVLATVLVSVVAARRCAGRATRSSGREP